MTQPPTPYVVDGVEAPLAEVREAFLRMAELASSSGLAFRLST
jgi:hypothetical protein